MTDLLIAALSLTALSGTAAYVALAGLVAGESSGLPLPGETALIAAAILASRGKLAIEAVIVIAASAAIVGDNLGYVLGRHGGRRLLVRPGRCSSTGTSCSTAARGSSPSTARSPSSSRASSRACA